MKKRLRSIVVIALTVLTVAVSLCACGTSSSYELTEDQKTNIWNQYIANNELDYTDYLESKWFVSGEVLDTQKQGDRIYVYAYVDDGMYVPFKGRAYSMSGSIVPVKLTLEADTMKLIEKEFPEDGESYDSSLKKLFTRKAYRKCNNYDLEDLNKALEEKVKAEWNVEIDNKYMLQINENGNYEITVTDYDGSPDRPFQYHVEETGTLTPLK